MGHGFHGELLVITRGYILKNQHLQHPYGSVMVNSPNSSTPRTSSRLIRIYLARGGSGPEEDRQTFNTILVGGS